MITNLKKIKEAVDVETIISVIKQDEADVQYFTKVVAEVKKTQKNDNNINKVFQCTLGKDRAFIDCNYFIRPCLVVPIEYSLNDYSIEEALKLINTDVANMKISNNNKCKNCYKRKLCRYCPGRFFLETGSYEIPPDFYCKMADALIKEFGNEI